MVSHSAPFSSARIVVLYLLAILVPLQALIVFWYRPANPYSFQQVEVKMAAVISLLVATAFVLFLPEILSALFGYSRRIYKSRYMRMPIQFLEWLSATPPVRWLSSSLSSFLSACIRQMTLLFLWCRQAYLRSEFAPGRRYFFVAAGVAIALVISPLVLSNASAFSGPAIFLFFAYAVFSRYNRLDCRVMIVAAMVFLASCPFLLMLNDSGRAELSAIYAYYALCTGIVLQLFDYAQNPKSLAYAAED